MNADKKSADLLEIASEASIPDPESAPKKSFWGKLKRGLLMTHTELIERVGAAVEGRKVLDAETLDHLEEALISSDLGVETALELIERVRKNARTREIGDLRALLTAEMAGLLAEAPRPRRLGSGPRVTLVVGVNGVGKTTSIAKLAKRSHARGEKVLIAAADTFRAAAIEQISLWGERLGIDVIRQAAGGDPAAVVFDAIQAARARGTTRLIVDTAGRLHTKDHLMAELEKIGRVIDREAAGWERETILVLDATTGQNALQQAKTFKQVVAVDGVLLAKLDGTAKGGMAVAIARDLGLPVLYLGVGETPDDLVDFDPHEFARALLG